MTKKISASILIFFLSSCAGEPNSSTDLSAQNKNSNNLQSSSGVGAKMPTGKITLLAGKYNYFSECSDKNKLSDSLLTQGVTDLNGLAIDNSNNIYTYQNRCEEVRKINPSGMADSPAIYAGIKGEKLQRKIIGYSTTGHLYLKEFLAQGIASLGTLEEIVRYDKNGNRESVAKIYDRISDAYLSQNDVLYILYSHELDYKTKEYRITKIDNNLKKTELKIKLDSQNNDAMFNSLAINSNDEIFLSQLIPAPTSSGYKYNILKSYLTEESAVLFKSYLSDENRLGLPEKTTILFSDGPRERNVDFSDISDLAIGTDNAIYIGAGSFLIKVSNQKARILANYKEFNSDLSWYNLVFKEIVVGSDGYIYFSDGNANIYKSSNQ